MANIALYIAAHFNDVTNIIKTIKNREIIIYTY